MAGSENSCDRLTAGIQGIVFQPLVSFCGIWELAQTMVTDEPFPSEATTQQTWFTNNSTHCHQSFDEEVAKLGIVLVSFPCGLPLPIRKGMWVLKFETSILTNSAICNRFDTSDWPQMASDAFTRWANVAQWLLFAIDATHPAVLGCNHWKSQSGSTAVMYIRF